MGAAGVGDGAVERCVPVEVVWAERTDRTNGAGGWVLKNGGEAGDASFGDGFKNDANLSEPDLRTGAVGAAVKGIWTQKVGLSLSFSSVISRSGEITIDRIGEVDLVDF